MMPATALLLFGGFAVLAGGVRMLIQRRRTGDAGVRQFSVPAGSTQWWGHWTAVLGALLTGLAAPIADLAGVPALPVLQNPILQGLGVVLAVLGILGTFVGQLVMGSSWRIGVDETEHTRLVTSGVFRVIRNPVFSALLVALLGLALMVPNVVAAVGFTAAAVGIEIQVRLVEEPHLRRVHASAYDNYTARVGRFLPRIGHRRPDRQRRS